MRVLLLVSIASLGLVTGCMNTPPPIAPDPPENPLVQLPPEPEPGNGERAPRVVRRLIAESREQVGKNRQMVSELPDQRGRDRANAEASAIESELDVLAARIENTDSDNLDEVMAKLQLLDTRIDIFHERLRAATSRTSAVAKD